ncbi:MULTISPECIES: lipid-A-disaccharide synthase [unclassified Motilimonas]|uniref:lipid-A-disaccharide synthase n=1 Tax=Motilimonas TaxID=1914248 RepID=UPI001E52193F|nr:MULTISPECIES: lipid-A-disaccharide synthase [unclassified Motilimonas]MCE0556295.1 lipid-A-disaccharide synthase [Motilimonas sp. E26]MDO6525035.1 lipid-A-disaccharide synthase [Motilimonas sp. 1_MG-2023]
MSQPLRVGIIAGEVSGDILAAGLIKSLRLRYPDLIVEGIAGPEMVEQGCNALFSMEELSVMGFVEVLGKLKRILHVRKAITEHFIANPPDIFIGVDAPDFNLTVELKLKQQGIKTIHYVSPSVWAWKQWRIHKIAKATNLVLAFLPFEKAFYDKFNVPCKFVGHTLAERLPLIPEQQKNKAELGLDLSQPYLAMLPGSRHAEIELLSPFFLQAAVALKQRHPALQFVVPMVNAKRRAQFEQFHQQLAPDLPITIVDGKASSVLQAADYVLLASGTASLEAMLAKCPMVVAYRVNWITYRIAKALVKSKYASLPNLLHDGPLVAELLQYDCTVENIVSELDKLIGKDNSALIERFTELHQQIRCNADEKAADAVIEVLASKSN